MRNQPAAAPNTDHFDAAARAAKVRAEVARKTGGLNEGDIVLGRYKLKDVLGAGGAGTVWRAFDEQLRRWVAVKVLPEDADARALAEARAAACLSHPAIVAVYALGQSNSRVWLVTELVRGETLRHTIRHDTHSDDELLQIGLALCSGLQHAHSRGIVHRDVTPRNVLIPFDAFEHSSAKHGETSNPGVSPAKLADFGIARQNTMESAQIQAAEVPEGEQPKPKKIVGTLNYMAPERLRGGQGDHAGDVWGLGAIMHEALVGRHPLAEAKTAPALLVAAQNPPSLAERRPDLSPELVEAIDSALSPDPALRPSAAALGEVLVSELVKRNKRPSPAIVDPIGMAGFNIPLRRSTAPAVSSREQLPERPAPSLPAHVQRVASVIRDAGSESLAAPDVAPTPRRVRRASWSPSSSPRQLPEFPRPKLKVPDFASEQIRAAELTQTRALKRPEVDDSTGLAAAGKATAPPPVPPTLRPRRLEDLDLEPEEDRSAGQKIADQPVAAAEIASSAKAASRLAEEPEEELARHWVLLAAAIVLAFSFASSLALFGLIGLPSVPSLVLAATTAVAILCLTIGRENSMKNASSETANLQDAEWSAQG